MFEDHEQIEVVGQQDCCLVTARDRAKTPTPSGRGHTPVLLSDMLAALDVRAGGAYLDATFGAGGYARAILQAGAGRVFAIDRDPAAVARGRELAAARPGFTMLEGRFAEMVELLAGQGVRRLDGIVLDLGVSSMQLDDPGRGFSFAADGPLDMRMSGTGTSAAEVVNRADADALADILRRYGEEPAARRIARAIIASRQRQPLARTRELAELVAEVLGGRPGRTHPATRTFQALRMHVNDELGELARALPAAETLLAAGGRPALAAAGQAGGPARAGRARRQSACPLGAPALGRARRRARGCAMSARLALGGLLVALLAACGLYIMKDRVSRLESELRRQEAMITAEQNRLHRLRAESAMLEQPGRIARLAAAHLELRPAQPTQIMTIDDLPRRADLAGAELQLRALLPSGAQVDLRLKPRRLALPLVSIAEASRREP